MVVVTGRGVMMHHGGVRLAVVVARPGRGRREHLRVGHVVRLELVTGGIFPFSHHAHLLQTLVS